MKLAGRPAADRVIATGAPYEALIARGEPKKRPPSANDEKGGVMIYTSGTTGKPKGAERDFQKQAHESVIDFLRQIAINHDDRQLVVCPLYHSAAPAFVAFQYLVGGTVILHEHFEPLGVLEAMAREKITQVRSWYRPCSVGSRACRQRGSRKKYDLSALRWLASGAAPLPAETARQVEAAFGKILFNFYGATDTGMVTLALPGEHTARPGTIGRALAGNEIRLYGEDGRVVARGQVGELYAKSSMLVSGYHRDHAATSQAMKDGFFSVRRHGP